MVANLIFLLAFSVLIAIFALTNSQAVSVNLIFWHVGQVSLAVLILVSIIIGAVFSGVLGLYHKIKDAMRIRLLEKELREYQKSQEIDS